MIQWTYGQLRTRVINELDLENETFIGPDEMVGFCNEALARAEAEIHKINEDYFLTNAPLSLVLNQQVYSLPSDIYAKKIRKIVYQSGAIIYEVRRIRGEKEFFDATVTDYFGAGLYWRYRYILINRSAAVGDQIQLHPVPTTENGPLFTIWYLRGILQIPLVSAGSQAASDATLIDIPEFYNYIIQYMKCKVLEKEGDPRLQNAMAVLANVQQNMVDTLTQMVPDDDDTIVPDFSHYWEHE